MPTEKHAFAALKRRLPHAYLVRIENSVGAGLPDVYGSCGGVSFWVELKMKGEPLRPAQRAVCRKLISFSVPVFVAYYDGRHLTAHRYTDLGVSAFAAKFPGESLA
jgi:hypothetical protein